MRALRVEPLLNDSVDPSLDCSSKPEKLCMLRLLQQCGHLKEKKKSFAPSNNCKRM